MAGRRKYSYETLPELTNFLIADFRLNKKTLHLQHNFYSEYNLK
jgi:hypothetical protein